MTTTPTKPSAADLFGAAKAGAAHPHATEAAAGIVARLAELRLVLDDIEERETAAYAERLALFHAGRALDPPIIMTVLAGASGVTEVAVARAFRKDRERSEAAAGS